ncbi:hypothetical protein [Metabacillus arenae]|uniref:Lipoprotein n=1 Tax=Metabacillus arenae TaxID=2771434 RepID=A0A926NIE2_9BACI|nr:hypothetical protein [Metabacillus arenae]MBD1382269.1 hypothetical protein [Metabacillus arenae]
MKKLILLLFLTVSILTSCESAPNTYEVDLKHPSESKTIEGYVYNKNRMIWIILDKEVKKKDVENLESSLLFKNYSNVMKCMFEKDQGQSNLKNGNKIKI